MHTIHTHLFLFTVDNICDPEQSPSDSIDPFITQNNFIIPATQDQDDSQEAEGDLLKIHSNRSSTPSLEDHDDDLTNAQKNLLRDLTKHKTNILKHEGLANHFNTLSSSPGSALPNFTKPILNLRDQKFFSSTCLNKLDEINKEYQKQVCSLLGAHQTEMCEQSRLFVDIRFRDIDSIYNNSTIRRRLGRLSKDLSIDAYTELLTKSKRNRGQKRPHP